MNKLDRYDAKKLLNVKGEIRSIMDYNYTSNSNRLYRKLNTILNKVDNLLNTELEPELQEEYRLTKRI